MKRVRYLAGVAGLVPAAAGVAIPAQAVAVTTAGTVAKTGKTVVLQDHARVRTCTGVSPFSISRDGNVKGHFWATFIGPHSSSICIGTVVVSALYNKTVSKDISKCSGPVSGQNCVKAKVFGSAGTWQHHSFGVHEIFRLAHAVCDTSQFNQKSHYNCHTFLQLSKR